MKKLFALCMVIALVFAIGVGAVSAKPSQQRGNVVDVFEGDSIQDAIDAAPNGAKIFVHEGTYVERLFIYGKDLSLVAVGEVTIEEPDPVESVSSQTTTIRVYESICTIDGFTIDAKMGWGGIYALSGFYDYGKVKLTIKNNVIEHYEKNGITINGEGATAKIMNNYIRIIPDSWWANNGIQIGYGATGSIKGNTIIGNYWFGDDWTACGILLFDVSGVEVMNNNVVQGNETGIAILGSNNKVINNYFENGEFGIVIESTETYEVYSWYYGFSGDENNKVINNTIEDFTYPFDDMGTDTKVHAIK